MRILAPPGGSGRIRVITPAGVAVSTGDLFIVPSGSNVSDVGYSGRATLGDTVTVNLNASAFGLLLFDGKAGNSVSVSVGSSSLSACTLQLYQPSGSLVGSSESCAAAGSLQAQVLPATGGTYTLRVTPAGGATGSAQITLTDASDVVNSIVSGGVSTVTTSVPGQKGAWRLPGGGHGHALRIRPAGAAS